MIGLSHIYFAYGEIPVVSKLFAGFIPAVTAIIITTAWGMSKKAITNWSGFFLGLAAAVMRFKVDIAYIIPCAGLIGVLLY